MAATSQPHGPNGSGTSLENDIVVALRQPGRFEDRLTDMLGMFAEFEANLCRKLDLESIAAAEACDIDQGRLARIDIGVAQSLRYKRWRAIITRQLGEGRTSVDRLPKQQEPVGTVA